MDKNLTIKERILFYAKNQGIDKADMFAKIGIATSNFRGNGLKSEMGGNKIVSFLTEYKDVSPEWLLTGEGDMCKAEYTPDTTPSIAAEPTSTTIKDKNPTSALLVPMAENAGIPLIPIDCIAGYNGDDVSDVTLAECIRYNIPDFEAAGAEYLIRVSGSSMSPLYNNGDMLACRKISAITFFQWGRVYVLDSLQGAMVKRVLPCDGDEDKIICKSDNPQYPPFSLYKTEIRSLSTVIGVIRLE
ncbi:MAG: S24 family peptidase [Bacteroidales bacterium]